MSIRKVLFSFGIACLMGAALVFNGCNGFDPFDPLPHCYKLTYTPTKGAPRTQVVDYVWMNGDDLMSHMKWIDETYGDYPSWQRTEETDERSCKARKDYEPYTPGESSGGGGSSSSTEFSLYGTWVNGSYSLIFYTDATFSYRTPSYEAYGTFSVFGKDITLRFTDCEDNSSIVGQVKMARITADNKIEFEYRVFDKY